VSLVLNAGFIRYAWLLKVKKDKQIAMDTFKYSIWHLLALFIVLLADHFIAI